MRPVLIAFAALAGSVTAASMALAQSSLMPGCSSPTSRSTGSGDTEKNYGVRTDAQHQKFMDAAKNGGGIVQSEGQTCFVLSREQMIGGRSLADVLTVDKKGRLWWDYARDLSVGLFPYVPSQLH
jgi:hypothetical protein